MSELGPGRLGDYLDRLGLDRGRDLAPDPMTLAELHVAHLRTVPFENLDIHIGAPIDITPEAVFTKVVERRRGGYCYELNSLFALLLREIGFEVDLLAARVADDDGEFGRPFDHLTLRVCLPDRSAYLADVGFGLAFVRPVPLVADRVHDDGDHRVRLVEGGDGWVYEDDRDDDWTARYTFSDEPRRITDFANMNVWQQTAAESHFTRQTLCTLATPNGRVTFSDDRLITTDHEGRHVELVDPSARDAVFASVFGIALPDGLPSASRPQT